MTAYHSPWASAVTHVPPRQGLAARRRSHPSCARGLFCDLIVEALSRGFSHPVSASWRSRIEGSRRPLPEVAVFRASWVTPALGSKQMIDKLPSIGSKITVREIEE